MRRTIVLTALLLGGCAIPHAIDSLGNACPPPELGRPGWVRATAGTGAWIGGVVGGVVSIAFLPVTYPISLLADDGLGPNGTQEFLLFPAISCAAIGHALFGGASDAVDYTFRRAWIDDHETVTTYDLVPQQAPLPPGTLPPRTQPPKAEVEPTAEPTAEPAAPKAKDG